MSVKVTTFACDSCPVKCRIEVVTDGGVVMAGPCPFGKSTHLWRMVNEERLDAPPESVSRNAASISPGGQPALFVCRRCPLPCFLETQEMAAFAPRRTGGPIGHEGRVCPVTSARTAAWFREDPVKPVPPVPPEMTATEVAALRRKHSAVSDYEAWCAPRLASIGESHVEPLHLPKVRKERDSS